MDFSKARYYGGVDNRSVLEKNIEVLSTADQCKVPLTGKTISHVSTATSNLAGLFDVAAFS